MLAKLINIIIGIFGLLLFSTITYIFYQKASKRLTDYSLIESKVLERGITKSDNNKDIFYIKISDKETSFSIYNMTQNYSEFQKQLNFGDFVKIYFEDSIEKENNDFEILQLEKDNKILIDYNKHKLTYYSLAFLCLIVNIFILLMLFHYLKYGKVENPIPPIF